MFEALLTQVGWFDVGFFTISLLICKLLGGAFRHFGGAGASNVSLSAALVTHARLSVRYSMAYIRMGMCMSECMCLWVGAPPPPLRDKSSALLKEVCH